jgi:hypothetical protein
VAGIGDHRFTPSSGRAALLGYGRLPEPTIAVGVRELAKAIGAAAA